MGVNLDLVLAVIPKIGGSLSMASSSFIIWEAMSDHRKGKGTAIQRALVGMSAVDVAASFAWFLSTWAVPKGTAPFARGNMASCNFQGFLLQLAVGSPLYNCSLALYYLFVIKFNWTNRQLVKIERYVHGFILTFAIGTAIAGLPLTMYNEVNNVCWVIGYPTECGNSNKQHSDVPCERGNWAWLFGIILFYGPLWVCVLLTMIAMAQIYLEVRRTFKRNEKYMFQGNFRRPSVMFHNRPVVGKDGPSTTGSAIQTASVSDSVRTNGNDLSNHERVDATGQLCSRMSRISVFKTKHPDFGELNAVAECADGEDTEAGEIFGDDEEKIEEETDEEPAELQPHARNAYTMADSEASGGIGLRSGWIQATESLSAKSPQGDPTGEKTGNRSSVSRGRPSQSSRAQRKQNLFAIQAILYSASFFITWTPSTIWSVALWFGVEGIGFDIAAATCEPLQGFWNMLIFIRSRPSSQEKIRRVLGGFCCFWMNLLPKMPEIVDSSVLDASGRKGRQSSVDSNMNGISQNSVEPFSTSERRPSERDLSQG